ncbi:MAG: TonB-dependent receptor [Ignavibacteriales bacterium]|nr:MAG: TonB-dependent receptor [Ignavibacteriales bacterium]
MNKKIIEFNMRFIKYSLSTVFIIIFFSSTLFAGVTGKIQGRISDKNTGESLIGVNILVVGTNLGSATDINGEYFILQVPPGEYTVRVSMIGYQEVIVQNVVVRVDLTTRLDIEIEEKTLELDDEVVVVAQRPIIQKDITSSTHFVGIAELERLPITDSREGVFLQTGVFFDPIPVVGGLGSAGRGEQRYSVRGGNQDEIIWYVDGARTSSLVGGRADWGGSFTNINLNAIEEVQVMTGGFNAEYGEAQSGIISVVTKEGKDLYHGSLEYIFGVPGQHHFGNYLYDPNTQKEFLDNTLPDGTLDPEWWTPYRQSQIYDYTEIPDHTIYASLGGPLFSIDGEAIKFFTSSQYKRQAYVYPHPRDSRNSENVFLNLSYRAGSSKLRLSGTYNHDAHSTLQENGDFTSQAKYYRGWGSLLDIYNYQGNLSLSQVVNTELFYELRLTGYYVYFKEGPGDFTQLGSSPTRDLFGFQKYENYPDEPFDKYTFINMNEVLTGDISLTGSMNWQFDKSNFLKTGFEFRYNTYDERKSYRFPSQTLDERYWLNRGLNETYHPIQLSFYIQDKMEFESMILNIGLRYDYFNPNRDWFEQTNLFNLAIDPNYEASKDPDNDQVDSNGDIKYSFQNVLDKPRSPAKSYHMISPRFGVSFPITENSLLHFNYGHFYQMPLLDQMFEFGYFRPVNLVEQIIAEDILAALEGREPNHIRSNDGDPERVVAYTVEPLQPQKTIMFEVGIKHNFEEIAVLDVTAFYKDVFDQTEERIGLFDRAVKGFDPFNNQISPNQSYATFLPGDYGDSRGFEISLRTLFSRNINLDLNYSFSRSTQGRASPQQVFIDGNGNVTYQWDADVNKRIPTEKSFSRPHILRANLYLSYPEEWTNSFLDIIMEGATLSILFRYISGQAFTYLSPEDPPDTYNNQRFPATQNVDLRFDKAINLLDSHQITLFLQVTNLLNTQNLRSYGDVLFDVNATKNYVENGIISSVDGGGYDISWQNYFEKRRIYLGAKYSF